MAQFEVDFSESLSQLAQFQLRLANMGKALDDLEKKGGKSTSASTKLLSTMNAEYDKLEKILVGAGADAEKLGKTMQTVRDNVNLMMSGLAANNLKATVQAQAYNGELAEMGRLLNDTASKNNYSAWQSKTLQLTNKLTNENGFLRAAIAATDTELGKSNANLKAALTHKQNMVTADQRLRNTGDGLVMTLASLTGQQGRSNVMTQAYIAARKSQITEDFRMDAQLRTLQRSLASLTGGQQEEIAKIQQLIAARKAQITEGQREDTQLQTLQRTLKSLQGGRQEEIAAVNAQIAARRRAIAEANTEKKVVDEMAAAIKREEAALTRLQAQAQLSSGTHGQRVSQLKEQIALQERHNKLLGMSSAQLLGFSGAQTRVNLAQELGSQSAAMLRAGLTGLHASVGMYTSATVLAATATYGISAAMRDTVVTGAEFYATMSRTRAVMSTGDTKTGWMDNAAQSSKALEMQVRALGQTTVFTASEVGDGLQQLGMAGLQANEAIVALRPALQLANLANVSMARSADISTNVLMTFGMQAKELQGVVDLMATAVNNSNADIEQLANSLSYAGPAAKTAGFSIQETTAAIETMANSGIKGSRSGSALRRMFTSLLNPTKKGSEVINKYGLDILDAEGNTRSLSNIIQQLSTKMKDLPGPERLAAITNLVGVYASSAVTGLVDNAGQFAKFAEQNQNVAGAGDRMEKIISDNLKFDWKEMLSSLEEVQLQAFSQMDMRLREQVAKLSKYVLDLMEPYKEGTDITGLDRMLVQAQTGAEALAKIIGGIVAYKFASGNIFGALATDSKAAAERVSVLAERMKVTAESMRGAGLTTTYATNAFRAQNAAAAATATGLMTLGNSTAWVASKMSMLATVGAGVMRAFGWVGLIYGIGSALYQVFSTNTDDEVLKHRDSVDDVKSSYDQLKASIEETGLARQRAAIQMQIGSDQKGVDDVKKRIADRTKLLKEGEAAGLPEEALTPLRTEITGLEATLGTFEQRVLDSNESLNGLKKTTLDYVDESQKHADRLAELIKLTNDLAIAQTNLQIAQTSGATDFGAGAAGSIALVEALTKRRAELMAQSATSGTKVQQTKANLPTTAEQLANAQQAIQAEADAKNYKKVTPLAQQLLDNEKAITAEKANQAKLIEQGAAAVAANDMAARPGQQLVETSAKAMAKLESDRQVLIKKSAEEERKLLEAKESAAAITRSDSENMLAQQKQLADIREKIAAAEKPGDGKAADTKELTKLYSDQAKVLGVIKGLESKSSKAGAKAGKQDDRQAQEDLRTYTSLAKKFDEVSAAQLELKKGTDAMKRLREAGTITVEQEAKAIGELNLQYYNSKRALDLNLIALDKVKASYNTSPFSQAAADLGTLNRNLEAGKISLQEYTRITDEMKRSQKENLKSSLPKADLNVGDASSSPFTDWVSTEMTRAKGMEDYQKALEANKRDTVSSGAGIDDNFKMQLEQLQARHLIEQGAEAEHNAKLLEINKQYASEKEGLLKTSSDAQKVITDEQLKYTEQMQTMSLMAAMGSISNVLGMFASAADGASNAQKLAFLAQKAITVAQIIMYTELAAAQALAVSGNPMVLGMPMAMFIRATGYANAALVGAMAIGQLAGGGSSGGSSSSGGGSTQMYDTGGYIPYNRTGIVGEYGPELVTGPAHVTGRGATKSKMGSGGQAPMEITLAPVIQIEMQGSKDGGGPEDQKNAKVAAETVKSTVMAVLSDQVRPNGMLYKFVKG